ncbi:MAG: RNA 2',3'-cyclic phosphodiesterase [Rhodospirillaceae bacterium]
MIRLFVAIAFPEDLRRRLAMVATGPREARWVPEENFHLTVRFIGEVNEDALHEIVPALGEVHSEPFDLTLTGAGHFETGGKVRQLWVGVEKNPSLAALRDRVESALVRAGLEPERRKFAPHVTIARLNNGASALARDWLAANSMFRAMPVRVDEFVLFSSFQGRSGSIYRVEAAFTLERV